jgi:hypothetical protein
MSSDRQGAKRRAPRLPRHLFQHAPEHESISPPEHRSLQSSPDPSSSALHHIPECAKAPSIHEQSRVTRSPLMHSAITQGAVPNNRVRKNGTSDGHLVSIQSVLGLPRCVPCRVHQNNTREDHSEDQKQACSPSISAPWRKSADPGRRSIVHSSMHVGAKSLSGLSKAAKFPQNGTTFQHLRESPTFPPFSSCHSCMQTTCSLTVCWCCLCPTTNLSLWQSLWHFNDQQVSLASLHHNLGCYASQLRLLCPQRK